MLFSRVPICFNRSVFGKESRSFHMASRKVVEKLDPASAAVKPGGMTLGEVEDKLFNALTTPYERFYTDLNDGSRIWTARSPPRNGPPLILVHGMAGGLGLWFCNLDKLAEISTVYAFDMVGFGRSSRTVQRSDDPESVERGLVDNIEAWREKLGIDQFVVLGHSLGGYLAASYAIHHPNRVLHLILLDPWGFNVRPETTGIQRFREFIIEDVFSLPHKLSLMRLAGRYGPDLLKASWPSLEHLLASRQLGRVMYDYIYLINSFEPTGESAFSALSISAKAKRPMIPRLKDLEPTVPITVVIGTMSWLDQTVGEKIREARKPFFVDVFMIEGATHQVHLDHPEEMHDIIRNVFRNIHLPQEPSRPS